jgi:hypothetical protein
MVVCPCSPRPLTASSAFFSPSLSILGKFAMRGRPGCSPGICPPQTARRVFAPGAASPAVQALHCSLCGGELGRRICSSSLLSSQIRVPIDSTHCTPLRCGMAQDWADCIHPSHRRDVLCSEICCWPILAGRLQPTQPAHEPRVSNGAFTRIFSANLKSHLVLGRYDPIS